MYLQTPDDVRPFVCSKLVTGKHVRELLTDLQIPFSPVSPFKTLLDKVVIDYAAHKNTGVQMAGNN